MLDEYYKWVALGVAGIIGLIYVLGKMFLHDKDDKKSDVNIDLQENLRQYGKDPAFIMQMYQSAMADTFNKVDDAGRDYRESCLAQLKELDERENNVLEYRRLLNETLQLVAEKRALVNRRLQSQEFVARSFDSESEGGVLKDS